MSTIKQTHQTVEFIKPLSPVIRVLSALLAFIPLLAPYEPLIKPSWQGEVSFILIVFLVSFIVAVGFSILMFWVALFGLSERFLFDASKRQFTYEFKTAFKPARQEVFSFDQLKSLEVKVIEWKEGPDTYDIVVKIEGKPEMNFGDFSSRLHAERYLTGLQNLLANRG